MFESNEQNPLLKSVLGFKDTDRADGTLLRRWFIYTLSGGVDKTLIYTKFGVDKFVHRRLKSMEKSHTLPEMRPPLRLSVEKDLIYTYFLK